MDETVTMPVAEPRPLRTGQMSLDEAINILRQAVEHQRRREQVAGVYDQSAEVALAVALAAKTALSLSTSLGYER